MRVGLCTNLLPPYRVPVYADLAATPGWSLRLFVDADSDPTWAGAFDGTTGRHPLLDVERVRGASFRRLAHVHAGARAAQPVTTHLPWGLPRALLRHRPDVVVSAELGARSVLAALSARILGVPLVVWSYHARSADRTLGGVRRGLRRALLAQATTVVGMGSQARELLEDYGVPGNRLFDAPNAHDHAAFSEACSRVDRSAARAALRAACGGRERIALVAGRLVDAKGVVPLLEAWRALPAERRRRWTLLFVGDGPRADAVRAAVAAAPGEVAHLPTVRAEAMADVYTAADLLVFPSLGDPWGLVVNEAFACGLPVLCSVHAGCADDLVCPGENGWLADPLDRSGFAAALETALTSPDLDRLGSRARDTAKRFGPEQMAAGLRRAIVAAAAAAAAAAAGGG